MHTCAPGIIDLNVTEHLQGLEPHSPHGAQAPTALMEPKPPQSSAYGFELIYLACNLGAKSRAATQLTFIPIRH